MPAVRFPKTPVLDLKLPPLPKTVTEVTSLLAEGAANVQKLSEIVEMDPTVAARLLKHVNSAFYAMPHKIARVDRAVFLLGFNKVCHLIMAISLTQIEAIFKDKGQREVYNQIIRRSLATAMLADELASQLELEDHKQVFSAGLLHNIGQIILLYNAPEIYEALWWSCESGLSPSPTEEIDIFGKSHHDLGQEGAINWEFPQVLIETIAGYNTPESFITSPYFPVIATVSATAWLAQHIFPNDPNLEIDLDTMPTPSILYKLSDSETSMDQIWQYLLEFQKKKTRSFVAQLTSL